MKGASPRMEATGHSHSPLPVRGGIILWTALALTLLGAAPSFAQTSGSALSTLPPGALTASEVRAFAPLTPQDTPSTTQGSGATAAGNASSAVVQGDAGNGRQLSGSSWSGDPVVQYEQAQDPAFGPPIGSINDYTQGDDEGTINPLGISIRADARKLHDGGEVPGLLVVAVEDGSPAAKAGIKSYSHGTRSAVEGAAMVTAIFVPFAIPAMALVPLLESSGIGENYFMIIGVDGTRVTDLPDLENSLRDVQPGETVYLSLIHNGAREQLPVLIPRH